VAVGGSIGSSPGGVPDAVTLFAIYSPSTPSSTITE
jgi:hypothetical protein